MGDQIRDAVEGTLFYAPVAEFDRVRRLNAPAAERLAAYADMARLNALYMIARTGSGHVGTTLSSLDVVTWLHLHEMAEGDVYFSSKGHDVPGLYSVLIGLGRLPVEKLHVLRRLGGLPGHPHVTTPGVSANTGSLGMGISKAKGMVEANRRLGRDGTVYVLTGDGELQEGQIWESLSTAVARRMHEIVAIVDHNKVQSDTFVERVNPLGDLEARFGAFGWHVARCDGHDMAALETVLRDLRAITDRPKVLIADTVKGKGARVFEHTAMAPDQEFYKYHSGAPNAAEYRQAADEIVDRVNGRLAAMGTAELGLDTVVIPPAKPLPANRQRMVPAYTKALIAAAERRPDIITLDADLILDTGLIPFRDRFPDRFVECGIAEQDMVSQASGMALKGLLPVVHSFSCFLTTRPNEQIYNACTEGTRIVYVGTLSGVLPGSPGHSHQSVRCISALGAMPGMVLAEPCTEGEVAMLLDWCVEEAPGSSFLRLVSIPCDVPYELPAGYRPREGHGVPLADGKDAVVIGYGPVMLSQAVLAAAALREQGIGLTVINLPWLNRVDAGWLRSAVAGARWAFLLDNHYLWGGQGQMLAAAIAELNLANPPSVRRFGVDRIPLCGMNDEVLKAHELDSQSLAAAMQSCIGRG